MNKAAKLLDAMRNNPRDWRIEQVKTVAQQYGITRRTPRGSHHTFYYQGVPGVVTVPAHIPINPSYIIEFVKFVDVVKALREKEKNG